MTESKVIQLSEDEVNLLFDAVQVYESSDENSYGLEKCENILSRLASILHNQP